MGTGIARATVGCGVALGAGAADGCSAGVFSAFSSDFFRNFLGDAEGVGEVFRCFFFGVGVGDFLGFAVAFFLCVAAFGFGVGLGDSSGDVDAAERALRNCARFSFSSSVNCAWRSVPMIPLRARAVASQRRKRTTAAERNRASGAINSRKRSESTREGFGVKLPASPQRAWASSLRVRVRGAGSRSICRPGAGANR